MKDTPAPRRGSILSGPTGRYLPLLLLPLGLLLYLNALHAPFTYDDRGYILENSSLKDLSSFLDLSGTRYLGLLSFALNYRIGGFNPFDFHLTNIAVHIANSVLIYFLVLHLLETIDGGWAGGRPLAFVSSLLFLCHPLESQAVAYVTQRFTSLATFFFLLAVLLYSKARGSAGKGAKFYAFYAGAFISTVAAMKTKEISFTIPFVLVIHDFVFYGWEGGKRAAALRIPFYLTLFIIPLSILGPELGFFKGQGMTEDLRGWQLQDAATVPRFIYVITQLGVIITYIKLFFFPAGQHLEYDYPVAGSVAEPWVAIPFFLLFTTLALAVFCCVVSWRRKNAHGLLFSFGVFWFFTTLSVESFMVPIQDVIYEHRAYLPSIGLVISITSAVFYVAGKVFERSKDAARKAAFLVLISFCTLLAFLTVERARVWSDPMELINESIRFSPNKARLYFARAVEYIEMKRYGQALADLDRAIGLYPRFFRAYGLRGIVNAGLSRYRESVDDFTTAIIINRDKKMLLNRALSYYALGDMAGAISDYTSAIEADKEYLEAYNNRGIAYSGIGETGKALEDFRTACSKGFKTACSNLDKIGNGRGG